MEKNDNIQRLGANRKSIYWIVYQTTNLVNNKIYIGVHKTKTPYEFDGYLGCGAYINNAYTYEKGKTYFHAALKKYGVKNFVRTTLKVFNNEDEAYAEEARLVDYNFLSRNDVYNMIPGGDKCCGTLNTEIYMYSSSGKYIQKFESITEASESIGVNQSTLSDACITKNSCKGYYWSKEYCENIDINNYHKLKARKIIYQYDLNGNFIKEFPSTRATGYSQASNAAILGNIVDKKYYFCYIKADTYSKARDIYVKNRMIYQFDKDGNYIKEWKYVDALKQFPEDSINQAIRHKKLTKSGFYWGIVKCNIYNAPIKKSQKTIAKYDTNGNLIETYKNASECYKINGKSVYKNLVGMRKTYKGYIYKYID